MNAKGSGAWLPGQVGEAQMTNLPAIPDVAQRRARATIDRHALDPADRDTLRAMLGLETNT